MHVALLGLTANPPHLGHLAISEQLKTLGYPQVWWSITPEQEFKPASTLIPYHHRRELAALLTATHSNWLSLDQTEAELSIKNEHNRTFELMQCLFFAHRQYTFTFVMGADSWAHPTKGFHTWGGTAQMLDFCGIHIIPRPDHAEALTTCPAAQMLADCQYTGSGPVPLGQWAIAPRPVMPVSSTQIRKQLAQGQSPQGLTPAQLAYIQQHNLYR